MRESDTICDHCRERPAVCIGRYEDDGDPEYACDECCGHGNEDGWCVTFDEVGELLTNWRRQRKEQEAEIERLSLAPSEVEALKYARANLSSRQPTFFGNVEIHRDAVTALDRLLAASEPKP